MKTGRNLQEVLVELNRQNQAKQDFISPAQGMRLREDGHTFEINHLTTSQQEVFGTTSLFHRQVASALGIPAKYYDLMQSQKPELLAENVNAWFADKPGSYMVRSMDYGAGQVARAPHRCCRCSPATTSTRSCPARSRRTDCTSKWSTIGLRWKSVRATSCRLA